MLQVSGETRLREVQAASAFMYKRVAKQGWPALALVAVFVVAGFGVASFASSLSSPDAEPIALLAAVAVVPVALVLQTQLRVRDFFRGLIERGVPEAGKSDYRIREDGLWVSGHGMDLVIHWSAVSELALGPTFWCVVGPAVGVSLPREFFATHDAERDFIRAMLERVDEAARDRSRDAVDFVGVWD